MNENERVYIDLQEKKELLAIVVFPGVELGCLGWDFDGEHLRVRVLRSTATLWHCPVNVLARILDVACLAVDAVL